MDYIKILGASGSLSVNKGTTCLQLSHTTLIDAGNIIHSLGKNAKDIEHIFITHSHFDHISNIPSILDLFFTTKTRTLNLYGLPETLEVLRNSLFNQYIFPDFSKIDLVDGSGQAIKYHVLKPYEHYQVEDLDIMPFPTNHTVPCCGFVVRKKENAIMFTSDTGRCKEVYDILNRDLSIKTLITEASFPSAYEAHANASLHLTPKILSDELKQLDREDLRILVMHMKPNFSDTIIKELEAYIPSKYSLTILYDGDIVPYGKKAIKSSSKSIYNHYSTLLKTGIALTCEESQKKLGELILESARKLTGSDAGTLYLKSEDGKYLQFQVVQNDSLGFNGEDSNTKIPWPPISLYDGDGAENHALVAAHCALTKNLVRVDDVYGSVNKFDFHNTATYDRDSGYHSKSMLLVPMMDYNNDLVGVLQLINKVDSMDRVVPYNKEDEQVIAALGSQATIAIVNQKLKDDFELLFESFLKTINLALDEKSPHMKGHVDNVLKLTMLIAHGIDKDQGIFADKHYTNNDFKTLQIAAMMHDIGKITTPMHVMDKGKKLETLFDKIELIKLRLELLKNRDTSDLESRVDNEEIVAAFKFLEEANYGKEYFDEEKIQRVRDISNWCVEVDGETIPVLDECEIENLTVRKGTLTQSQRDIINHHVTMSIKMLDLIEFPKRYERVPEIAGNHHEKIDGTGYPNGLKGDEISFEARILAIADIFEALTSSDRPYKSKKKLSEAMEILFEMAKNNHIDRKICKFFYESGIYLEYARGVMDPEYIDEVDVEYAF